MLGIILAGVLTDYKESEKIPAEMAASLCSIWEETCIQEKYLVQSQKDNTGALLLQKKVYEFVKKIKTDFLTGKPDSIRCLNDILDSFSAEFLSMDSVGTPIPIMTRLRNEQANIRKLLFRIQTIRDTSFAPSLAKMVEAIIFLFTIFLLLLKFDHLINSAILMFFYAFLLTSILFLLNDLDNPFEYNQKAKIRSDEIDFELLFNRLEVSFKKKIDD